MNLRQKRITEIVRALGNRRLIFFGTRGADAETLRDEFPRQLAGIFSQVAPLQSISVPETCIETMMSERKDLDSYDIDRDRRPVIETIRKALLDAFQGPAAVLAYRSSAVLASAWFPRSDRVTRMALFHEQQAIFDHKPWVERELYACGVKVLHWDYFADVQRELIEEMAQRGPLVLRTNRTDGGIGVRLIQSPKDVDGQWPEHTDGFLGVAPFLWPNIPLNINACVFPNGEVALHGPSVQLIGVPVATNRRFGYCGNDFAAVSELDDNIIDQLEVITRKTGGWLGRNGYVGAFGIDALVHQGTVYLTEVNARFQGSSLISTYIDRDMEQPDLFMDHMAAFLNLAPIRHAEPLRELVRRHQQCPYAHLVCHNLSKQPVQVRPYKFDSLPLRCRLIPAENVLVDPEAITVQIVFQRRVTKNEGQNKVMFLPETESQAKMLIDGMYCEQSSSCR